MHEKNQGDVFDFKGSDGIINNKGNSRGFIRSDHEHSPRENNKGNSRGVIRNDHENSPEIIGDVRIGIAGDDSKEIIRDDFLGHYEVYVVSPQLKEGLGIALIDLGSQVSLVKESS